MTNLPTHITKHLTTISKSLVKTDQNILKCIVDKPIPFSKYSDNDLKKLSASLNVISVTLGLKETLGESHRIYLCKSIQEFYPNFNLQEFEIAFRMAGMGKLDVENKHYQSFSMQYISDILKAYHFHRGNVYKNYKQKLAQIERDKPAKKITEKESIIIGVNLLEAEYKDYALNPDHYCESEFRYTQYKFMYKFLLKYGFIKALNNYDDKLLKEYIVKFFSKIYKGNYDLKQYLRDNWNK
tara:strand:+ start:3411 stop:4130 length:720 start_codon:yes stop_codon:yes gene_type:complete